MPVVEAHIPEGYSQDEKARLGRALRNGIRQVVPVGPGAVTVKLREAAHSDDTHGGMHRKPARALPDPVAVVQAFLAAMEARDLDAARAHLGAGFEMVFPGGATLHTLQDLIAWSKPRYAGVGKTFDGFDVSVSGAATIVFARGTLSGQWRDGCAFAGIRFVDRFELVDGRIVRQEVWNDMGEARAAQ